MSLTRLCLPQFCRQGRGDFFQGLLFLAELSTPFVCLGKVLIQVSSLTSHMNNMLAHLNNISHPFIRPIPNLIRASIASFQVEMLSITIISGLFIFLLILFVLYGKVLKITTSQFKTGLSQYKADFQQVTLLQHIL